MPEDLCCQRSRAFLLNPSRLAPMETRNLVDGSNERELPVQSTGGPRHPARPLQLMEDHSKLHSRGRKSRFYAVRVGREGPAIYDNWNDCREKVSRFPGAEHKSFSSLKEAEDWVGIAGCLRVSRTTIKDQFRLSNSGRTVAKDGSSQRKNATGARMGYPVASTSQLSPQNLASLEQRSSKDASNTGPVQSQASAILPPTSGSSVRLSPEQETVLDMVKEGKNVFFTGSAGTGKSVLLREIIRTLGGRGIPTVGITASTGIAAVNIGGVTLHSWAGIRLGEESAIKIANKLRYQPLLRDVWDRWRNVRTLLIDENGVLFDKLEEVARNLRESDAPFGGIQLVLSGDFFQLPPVPNRRDKKSSQPIFAFDAKTWNSCVGQAVFLTHVFRQRDEKFVNMLNTIRMGNSTPEIVAQFKNLARAVEYADGFEATEIFSTRFEVERANQLRLQQLPPPIRQYLATDSAGPNVPDHKMKSLLNSLMAPEILQLRVGAQVMLIKNLKQGVLVNGSRGRVISLDASNEPIEAPSSEAELASQQNGSSDPNDASQASRSLGVPQPQYWPRVLFQNGIEYVCKPEEFTLDNPDGTVLAKRTQVPLILAWALSVHKSQGQTLERVKVNLERTFEKGQAYVALSRATNLDTLQVLGFNPKKVMAHPRVLEWYRYTLEEQNSQDTYSDMHSELLSDASEEMNSDYFM